MDVFASYENSSSRGIALYSSTDYSRWYPTEISFLTDQLALPTPLGTQVCYAERFRLFKFRTREVKGDSEGIPHTHPTPQVIRLELFLTPQISREIRQKPIT